MDTGKSVPFDHQRHHKDSHPEPVEGFQIISVRHGELVEPRSAYTNQSFGKLPPTPLGYGRTGRMTLALKREALRQAQWPIIKLPSLCPHPSVLH
jgi:hypothetical protein